MTADSKYTWMYIVGLVIGAIAGFGAGYIIWGGIL